MVANALDNLGGSSALISIRGRATFSRPFERVEALKRQADDRLRAKVLELQSELQQTESKLTELQSKRNDQASLMLTPEQEQELKRFTAEKAHVRKELRETQRGLDVEINRLDVWLKVLNIAVAPLAVALAGALLLSLRRRRRASGRQARMSRGRFTALLIAALVVLAAALYLGSRRNSGEPSAEGMRFLPQLAGALGTVSQIDLQKGARHCRLSRCIAPATNGP